MSDMYDWEHCDHKGIGRVGCPTCDPDKGRVMIRSQRLDNRDLRARLAAAESALAASQAREEGLRKLLEWVSPLAHRYPDGTPLHGGDVEMRKQLTAALAPPRDTSALEAYGRRVAHGCADRLTETACAGPGGYTSRPVAELVAAILREVQ